MLDDIQYKKISKITNILYILTPQVASHAKKNYYFEELLIY